MIPDFKPYNDVALSDMDAITEHNNLINQFKYAEATQKIINNGSLKTKGLRSSFFNLIENKIRELQLYCLNKTAEPQLYYSFEEPDLEFMREQNKTFWIKPL